MRTFIAAVLFICAAAGPAAAQNSLGAKGYLVITHAAVTPAVIEKLKPYSAATRPLLAKYGGRFVIGSGKAIAVEGGWAPPFVGMIEFPSLAQARAFYDSPEYQAILPIRLEALPDSKAFLIEGTAPP